MPNILSRLKSPGPINKKTIAKANLKNLFSKLTNFSFSKKIFLINKIISRKIKKRKAKEE